LKRISDKSLFSMALGSRDHRITHQLRPINMNGRSILSVMSIFGPQWPVARNSGEWRQHKGREGPTAFPGCENVGAPFRSTQSCTKRKRMGEAGGKRSGSRSGLRFRNQPGGSADRASLAELPGNKSWRKLDGSQRCQVHPVLTEQYAVRAKRSSRKRQTKPI